MARGLPHIFVAQVDLTESTKLGAIASTLPSDGRLLFLYDFSIGPWDTGRRVAKVIRERSAVDELRPLAMTTLPRRLATRRGNGRRSPPSSLMPRKI